MCECIKAPCVVAGWKCHGCTVYNGMQRTRCRACDGERCNPLLPDSKTGERFETYEEAYVDDPEMLVAVNTQLNRAVRVKDAS